LLRAAKEAHRVVVLDVVVGMSQRVPLQLLEHALGDDAGARLIDVVVAEMPDIFEWFGIAADEDELQLWERHRDTLVEDLREHFPVAILRTSGYTHEVIILPEGLEGPMELDYPQLEPRRKTGYGDLRTARQLHEFMSPRVVLASKSPQRLALLSQIIALSKIQVVVSSCVEEKKRSESPEDCVKRLAQEKAISVYDSGRFHDDVELIIGADTEIVTCANGVGWEMVGHPEDIAEALRDLECLNGHTHRALTGVFIIGSDPSVPGRIKRHEFCVQTEVTLTTSSKEQLRVYAESGEPIRRAGAYAIQGLGSLLVKSITGSYSNVVGLPLEKLSQVLAEEFNMPIWGFDKVSKWRLPNRIKEKKE
jgi:septum formation protein